jgi:hypothetical protein
MTAVEFAPGGDQGREPLAQLRTSPDPRTLREVHRLLAASDFATNEERAAYQARTRLSARVGHADPPPEPGAGQGDQAIALPRRH